jgi:hypothetical protein
LAVVVGCGFSPSANTGPDHRIVITAMATAPNRKELQAALGNIVFRTM